MSFLDPVIDFLFDPDRRLSAKASAIVLLIVSLCLLNNILGFTYYYAVEKKIHNIEKLNAIINGANSDVATIAYAKKLRAEVIERENIFYHSFSFLRNISLNSSKSDHSKTTSDIEKPKESITRNNFLFHITAGGFYYLAAIIMIPILFFVDKTSTFFERLATAIATGTAFFGIGWFFFWLFSFIPQLSNTSWLWNYFVNLILQIGLVTLFLATAKSRNTFKV